MQPNYSVILQKKLGAKLSFNTFFFGKGVDKSLDEINLDNKESCSDYVNRLYAKLNIHNVIFFKIWFSFHFFKDFFYLEKSALFRVFR